MSLPALAPVSALEVRLGVAVGSLAGLDLARAEAALEDASNLVRTVSGESWVDGDGEVIAPPTIVVVVLQAAKRAYINPDGLSSEHVEGYSWQADQRNIDIYLSDEEMELVLSATRAWRASLGQFKGVGSVPTPPRYLPGRARYGPWGERW